MPNYKSISRGFPDRALIKGKEIVFVEIKENNSGLSKYQTRMFSILKEAGFKVFIARFKFGKFKMYPYKERSLVKLLKPVGIRLNKSNDKYVHEFMSKREYTCNYAINKIIEEVREMKRLGIEHRELI